MDFWWNVKKVLLMSGGIWQTCGGAFKKLADLYLYWNSVHFLISGGLFGKFVDLWWNLGDIS